MFKDWQVALIDWCLENYRISSWRGCLWGASVLGLCSVCSEWPNPINALGWFTPWSWARTLQEEDLESVNSLKSVVKIWKRSWGDRPGRSQKEDFKSCQTVLRPENQLAPPPFVWPTLSLSSLESLWRVTSSRKPSLSPSPQRSQGSLLCQGPRAWIKHNTSYNILLVLNLSERPLCLGPLFYLTLTCPQRLTESCPQ